MIKVLIPYIVVAVSVGLGTYGVIRYFTPTKDKYIEQERTIERLKNIIIAKDSIHVIESNIREQENEKRGNLLLDLKKAKKTDSLTYIHSIKQLMLKYKYSTDEELIKNIKDAYEKAMLDTVNTN